VSEPGHGLRLADQAGAGHGIDGSNVQQLERDLALELGIVGAQHPAHAAAAEFLDE
jgi:hypothetical protein